MAITSGMSSITIGVTKIGDGSEVWEAIGRYRHESVLRVAQIERL